MSKAGENAKLHEPVRKQTINLWDRQPGESAANYEMFQYFNTLGADRDVKAIAKKYKKKMPAVYKICTRYQWFKRVNANADYKQSIRNKSVEKEIENEVAQMLKRHSEHAQGIEMSIMVPVQKFLKKIKTDNLESLPAKELLQLVYQSANVFNKIADAERKANGLPTEINKSNIDHTSDGKAIESSINIIINGTKSKMLKEYGEKADADTDQ
jgi:hypothetical protein